MELERTEVSKLFLNISLTKFVNIRYIDANCIIWVQRTLQDNFLFCFNFDLNEAEFYGRLKNIGKCHTMKIWVQVLILSTYLL